MLKQPLQCRLMAVILVSFGLGICAQAAEPLHWERVPNRPTPAQFDTFHGESLDFRCTFKGFGTLPFSPSESGALPPRLYYQTNGMGAAWWSLPATVASNTVSATFPPSADPGAERLTVFFGAPSNAYAAAQVRFRDSPGAQPNNLDPPSVLDWMAELSTLSNNLARAIANAAPADYAIVSNRAMSALQEHQSLAPSTNYTDTTTVNLSNNLARAIANAAPADYAIVSNRAMSALQEHQSLAPSTNYTDATAVSLSNNLAAAMSAALDGKANKSHLKRVVFYRNETMDETVDVEMEKIEFWGRVIWRTPWRDGGYLYISEENGQMRGVIAGEDDSDMELVSNVPPCWGFDGYVLGELTFRAYTDVYGQETLIFRYDLADVVYSDEIPEIDTSSLATKQQLQAVSNEAQVVYRLFSGSNVVAEVTNYNSQVNAPQLRLLQFNESNEYFTVWAETNGLARTLAEANSNASEQVASLRGYCETNYAPRAWSRTTSGLGVDTPPNTTWISTPTTVIAGGYEPEKWITSGGAIWLITSNGMAADFSPATNNAAYLNIAATDGTPMFRIEKTDSYLVGVNASSVSVDGNALVVGVDIVAADHPLVRVCSSLAAGTWVKEENGIPAGLATVTWSGSAGAYVCRISNNTGGGSLFAYFEYLQEGGTKIINEAVLDIGPGILCTDGIHKARPVYSNGSISWEVVP